MTPQGLGEKIAIVKLIKAHTAEDDPNHLLGRRMDFIQSVAKSLPLTGEYDYVQGPVLVRASRYLTPDQAKEYEAALKG